MITLLMLLLGPASDDYDKFAEEDQVHIRYISLPEQYEGGPNYGAALRFVLCSSSLQQDLRRNLPVKINERLYRIDLRDLKWDLDAYYELDKRYPYFDGEHALMIDGRWLIDQLTDMSRSDAYYLMLFGKEQPKTVAEFFKLSGVEFDEVRKGELTYGLVETDSKVAVQKIRTIEFIPRYGGYASVTHDYRQIDEKNSPFETLDDPDSDHDAEEIIIGIRKIWESGIGALQIYALSDGDGNIVNEAPVDIAEDHSRFAGVASVRTPGSCMSCHAVGLNQPSQDGIRRWIQSGVEVYASGKGSSFIERFWLTDTGVTIKRSNEDFQSAVLYVSGLTSEENAANLLAVVNEYRRPVSLEQAALEFGISGDDLKLAIANASESETITTAHIVSLSHGFTVPRKVFETIYLELERVVQSWQSLNDVVPSSPPSSASVQLQPEPEPEPKEEPKPVDTPSRSRVIRTYRR